MLGGRLGNGSGGGGGGCGCVRLCLHDSERVLTRLHKLLGLVLVLEAGGEHLVLAHTLRIVLGVPADLLLVADLEGEVLGEAVVGAQLEHLVASHQDAVHVWVVFVSEHLVR